MGNRMDVEMDDKKFDVEVVDERVDVEMVDGKVSVEMVESGEGFCHPPALATLPGLLPPSPLLLSPTSVHLYIKITIKINFVILIKIFNLLRHLIACR